MGTKNTLLPNGFQDFVDTQVGTRCFGTFSEYSRELICKDQDRRRLQGMLLAGSQSAPTAPVDAGYFYALRERIKGKKST